MSNQLPLDSWREVIGYMPWHLFQLSNDKVPVTSSCNTLVYERSWFDANASGRADIRRAIEVAESRLREHLNFSVGQRFIEETLQYPRPMQYGSEYYASIDADGELLAVQASEGYIRAVGVEARTALDLTAAVTYSDPDGDTLNELATITVLNVSATLDTTQVAIYFGASDRLNSEAVSEKYRILPVQVSLSGTTLTIKAASWLFVKPIKYQGFSKVTLNPSDAANFVTTVAVYRRFCDPTGTSNTTAQATLIWETEPYPYWACCGNGSPSFVDNAGDPAAIAYAVARVGIRDAVTGMLSIGRADYNSTEGQWFAVNWGLCRQPDRVIVRYEAGAKLAAVESTMYQAGAVGRWDEVVARLAAAELSERICACDTANRELYRWQFDLARAAGANDEQYRISDRDLSNPLGTKAGQVYAWKQIQNLMIVRSFLAG